MEKTIEQMPPRALPQVPRYGKNLGRRRQGDKNHGRPKKNNVRAGEVRGDRSEKIYAIPKFREIRHYDFPKRKEKGNEPAGRSRRGRNPNCSRIIRTSSLRMRSAGTGPRSASRSQSTTKIFPPDLRTR